MRTQPTSTEIKRFGRVAAEHELGRATADVDDQERPGVEVEPGGRAAKRKPRFLVARRAARA